MKTPSAQELASAVVAYEKALGECGNNPKKMSSYCTAQGDNLDTLFFRMVNLAKDILLEKST